MINLLITLLVLVLIFGMIWWIFTALVPLPAPFAQIAQILIAVIFLFLIIGVFFGGVSLPSLKY